MNFTAKSINSVWLLLGGNIGNVARAFESACVYMQAEIGLVLRKSHLYESEPWGFEHENNFINQVVELHTSLAAQEVMRACLHIESLLGRVRTKVEGYESRVIDIDVLYYNSDSIESDIITVPHILLHKRRFALLPLCELIPNYIHPVLHKSNTQLLQSCDDKSVVTIINS